METQRSWKIEIVCCLLIVLPIAVSGLFLQRPTTALFAGVGLLAFYWVTIALFGRGSCIEMGVITVSMALTFVVMFPVFERAKLNAARRQHLHSITTQRR